MTHDIFQFGIQPELLHFAASIIVFLGSVCVAVSGWLIRRAVRSFDDLVSDYQETKEITYWCKTVLEQANFVRPIGPGIGGRA